MALAKQKTRLAFLCVHVQPSANHGVVSACVVSLLRGSSPPPQAGARDIPMAFSKILLTILPACRTWSLPAHPPPCAHSDLFTIEMSRLNPSEIVRDFQKGRGRALLCFSLPSWTLHACISPKHDMLPRPPLHTLLPLFRAIFSLVYLYSSELHVAVTSKESTLTSPS